MRIGEVVTWKNPREMGRIHRGKILTVVEAGQHPSIQVGYRLAAGSFAGSGPRDHESYVVSEGCDVWWPNVCDLRPVDEAHEVAHALSHFVNGLGNRVEDVVKHLSDDHRTLQQGITKFCVAWLEQCARQHKERDFDLRNEASAELGRKFVDRTTPQERAMPFI